jgi:2-dehydro-3-deoxygalactonokinase
MSYLAVDSGTTNSRIWLMQDKKIITKKQIPAGVRDSAISGDNRVLVHAIQQAVLELRNGAGSAKPEIAVAAGMITSNLGLHEVKHVQAPAGIAEVAAGVQSRRYEETEEILFHFIPGVRSGPSTAELDNVNAIDIMRGEETEILGALEAFNLQGPLLYIHLGSHTKLIRIDRLNRITAGASTLAGELLYAVQQHTILRSSLPEAQLPSFNEKFFQGGWENSERLGLTRSLYQVRIFNLSSNIPKESLSSFFLGAVLGEEFRCLHSFTENTGIENAILSGLPHLHPAWNYSLERAGFSVRCLSAEDTEKAFLTGLLRVFEQYKGLNNP